MQLFVASSGGHLTQLIRLRAQMTDAHEPVMWVTYNSSQGRSLQRNERVLFGYGPSTRNIKAAIRNYQMARRVLNDPHLERVISTGAGIAVPFLVEAARRGLEAVYVESATRTDGPSLSGRMLERVGGVTCYSQWSWRRRGWTDGPCVFGAFSPEYTGNAQGKGRTILVTLGTHPHYRFPRLVNRVAHILEPNDRVVWQTGATPAPHGIGRSVDPLDPVGFERLVGNSDVIIGHAGIGTALTAMQQSKCPILVPRRRTHGEHVDDHQVALARSLDRRGLALAREASELIAADVVAAASRRVSGTVVEDSQTR